MEMPKVRKEASASTEIAAGGRQHRQRKISSSSSTVHSPSSSSASLLCSRPCSVCSGPSNGFYFGVLSCRACASFFRRSAMENRQYVCRKGSKCDIRTEGMRNSCRACRLQTCIDAGMCAETAGTITTATSSIISNHGSTCSSEMQSPGLEANNGGQPKFCLNMVFDPAMPNIMQLAQSMRNTQNSHRALVNVLLGKLELPNGKPEPKLITLDQHIQLDRGLITLNMMLMREYFPDLEYLDNERKVHILKFFHMQLGLMHGSEYTIRAFPEMTSKFEKHISHPGCLIDVSKMEYFFQRVDTIEEHIRICIPLLNRISDFIVRHYRPLAMNQLEFAALVGILLYNCVDRFIPLSTQLANRRNELFKELHALLAQQLGGDATAVAVRFGQLLTFQLEMVNLTYEMEEVLTVIKIFLPLSTNPDVWDDLLKGRSVIEPINDGSSSSSKLGRDGDKKTEEQGASTNIKNRKSSADSVDTLINVNVVE